MAMLGKGMIYVWDKALDFASNVLLRMVHKLKLMGCFFLELSFHSVFLDHGTRNHGKMKPWVMGTTVPTL